MPPPKRGAGRRGAAARRRGGSGFTYRPPNDDAIYAPVARIEWFAANGVPALAHQRALYFHIMNVMLENTCIDDVVPQIHDEEARAVWEAVHESVIVFWLDARVDAGPDQRRLMWTIVGRMYFLLHRADDRIRTAHRAAILRERSMIVAEVGVAQYTVAQLWRALMVLVTEWNTLQHSEDLRYYVRALAVQCGRYFWTALKDRRPFDHPSFVSRVGDMPGMGASDAAGGAQCFCVNAAFALETERLLAGLLQTIRRFDALLRHAKDVTTVPRGDPNPGMAAWLKSALAIGAVRELIARGFAKDVYERRALVGEIERFADKDPHADINAYNAIANTRAPVINATQDLLRRDRLMESMLESVGVEYRNDNDDNMSPEECSDRDALVLMAAGFLIDEAFGSDSIQFSTWFISPAVPPPPSVAEYPVLVSAWHAWHVVFGDAVWLCETAADAFACWIRLLCRTSEPLDSIQYVAPKKKVFFSAFRAVLGGEVSFAERDHVQKEQLAYNAIDFIMPDVYGVD